MIRIDHRMIDEIITMMSQVPNADFLAVINNLRCVADEKGVIEFRPSDCPILMCQA